MRDIIFINPPNHATKVYLPIGIGYLNEILKGNNINSDILDIQNMILNKEIELDDTFIENIKLVLSKVNSKIFAFSIMSTSYPWTIELIKIVKQLHKDSKIIVGGPHVTSLREQILIENPNIDVASIFEGEKVITPLVKSLLKNDIAKLSSVKNIYYKDKNNKIIFNGEEPLIEDLNSLPNINFNEKTYQNLDVINLDVGRGCAFNCIFCSTNHLWKKTPRFKSGEKIVTEIKFYLDKIKNNENTIIVFEHDNFLIKKDILLDLKKYKKELNVEFDFGCSARINYMDDEMIKYLEESSCKYIFFGIETGSERMQKICRKNLDLKKVVPTIKKITDKKILVETNYIVGFLEESLDELFKTFDLMAKVKWTNTTYSMVNLSIICPEPESELGKSINENDYVLVDDSRYFFELKQAGLNPLNYNKQSNPHLYTIKNNNYDILNLKDFAYIYLDLLTNYPITLFILIEKYKIDLKEIYKIYNNSTNKNNNNIDKSTLFISEVVDLVNFKELYSDIFSYENLRVKFKNQTLKKGEVYNFKYNIQTIYNELQINPSIILNKTFDLCNTVIRI